MAHWQGISLSALMSCDLPNSSGCHGIVSSSAACRPYKMFLRRTKNFQRCSSRSPCLPKGIDVCWDFCRAGALRPAARNRWHGRITNHGVHLTGAILRAGGQRGSKAAENELRQLCSDDRLTQRGIPFVAQALALSVAQQQPERPLCHCTDISICCSAALIRSVEDKRVLWAAVATIYLQ
jgi:hypothetical protein